MKNCKNCGKFHTNKSFCSKDCQHEYEREKVVLECERCEEAFTEIPSRSERATYCSWECRKDQQEIECEECGEIFTTKRSHSGRRKYCSVECMANSYTLPEEIRHDSKYGPSWSVQRVKALERDGWQCNRCSMSNEKCREKYNVSLHVHHIKPYRTFDDNEEAHKLDNLITLCPSCHREAEAED